MVKTCANKKAGWEVWYRKTDIQPGTADAICKG